jgi:predicted transcriptional regulator of viral defense system
MVWYLWSANRAGEPQGVYSHDTALSIYSLSSWNSDKLHMTVPAGFQRMVFPPVLQLHRKRLTPDDVGIKYGVRVTKPLKTIIDLLKDADVPRKYLQEAIAEAIEQQIILPSEIDRAEITPKERKLLQTLVQESVK